jgi:hypothetical protein
MKFKVLGSMSSTVDNAACAVPYSETSLHAFGWRDISNLLSMPHSPDKNSAATIG